jgi:hypothetical protein
MAEQPSHRGVGAAAVIAVTAMVALGFAGVPVAHADDWHGEDWGLNGVYLATSNGNWAQTQEVYKDEATVQSKWTVSMNCPSVIDCSGRVTSDAGWSADIVLKSTELDVQRDIPNWEPCEDGTTVTGHQRFRFFPVDETGFLHPGSNTFAGFDKTTGESGGCRLNEKLVIDMPFRLDKIS